MFGPGWRMYYTLRGTNLIVMVGGGQKASQQSDIARAIERASFLEIESMKRMINANDLPNFDVSDYLEDADAIAEYLTVVLEDGDPALLIAAIGDIARAKGMSEVSRESGLAREALYKALRAGSQPRFDTVMRVLKTLGVRLVAQPMTA